MAKLKPLSFVCLPQLLCLLMASLALAPALLQGQQTAADADPDLGPHARHHRLFHRDDARLARDYDSIHGLKLLKPRFSGQKCRPLKEVYGFHPAWNGTAYHAYDYTLLTTLGYFSYEVDPETGSYTHLNQWKETELVDVAHQGAARVELVLSLFGGTAVHTFLSNDSAQVRLADSAIALVKLKDADGLCVDFEGIQRSDADGFARFVKYLSRRLKKDLPDSRVSVCIYAVDWNRSFVFSVLNDYVDRYVLMAYDYHWAGSSTAGPVAPLDSSATWGRYAAGTSISYYLDAGVPPSKMLLGVPYYGYKWAVKDSTVPAATSGRGQAILLRMVDSLAAGVSSRWNEEGDESYYDLAPSSQLWIPDTLSLGKAFDMAKAEGLAGVGIWALGYDHGKDDYWNLLQHRLFDCEAISATQTVKEDYLLGPDGGATRARNKDNWMWMLGGCVATILILIAVKRMMS